MICPHCGADIKVQGKFCPNCGEQIFGKPAQQTQEQQPATGRDEPTPRESQPASARPETKQPGVVSTAVVLVLLAGLVWYLWNASTIRPKATEDFAEKKVLPWATSDGLRKLDREMWQAMAAKVHFASDYDPPLITDANPYSGDASVDLFVVGHGQQDAYAIAQYACRTLRNLRPDVSVIDVTVTIFRPPEHPSPEIEYLVTGQAEYAWRQQAVGEPLKLLRGWTGSRP